MKKRLLIFILLCLALSGCRTRTLPTPEGADTVLLLTAALPEETPEPTPEPTETPPPEPEKTPEPEETAVPDAAATEASTGDAGSGDGVTYTPAAEAEEAAPAPREPARGNFTVSFDGNGGRVKSRDAKLERNAGDAFGAMPTPLREGFAFLGWFTAPEDGEPVAEESVFPGDGDLTLYAHWEYDPYEFWSFTLQNRTQQVYLCQQTSIYFETAEDGVTRQNVGLISAAGSLNIAESRDDPNVTDDWVAAKRPRLILKCLDGASDAGTVRQAVAARFPGTEVALVSPAALGNDACGLYARLALAKHLYGDWYDDVDLGVVAEELGVTSSSIIF